MKKPYPPLRRRKPSPTQRDVMTELDGISDSFADLAKHITTAQVGVTPLLRQYFSADPDLRKRYEASTQKLIDDIAAIVAVFDDCKRSIEETDK